MSSTADGRGARSGPVESLKLGAFNLRVCFGEGWCGSSESKEGGTVLVHQRWGVKVCRSS